MNWLMSREKVAEEKKYFREQLHRLKDMTGLDHPMIAARIGEPENSWQGWYSGRHRMSSRALISIVRAFPREAHELFGIPEPAAPVSTAWEHAYETSLDGLKILREACLLGNEASIARLSDIADRIVRAAGDLSKTIDIQKAPE